MAVGLGQNNSIRESSINLAFKYMGLFSKNKSYSSNTSKEPLINYTVYVETIKALKQDNKDEEAIKLLQLCVMATEEESKRDKCGVAPWYYEQLAIIFRKEKKYSDELAILERYSKQKKAPGLKPKKLAKRLEDVKNKMGI